MYIYLEREKVSNVKQIGHVFNQTGRVPYMQTSHTVVKGICVCKAQGWWGGGMLMTIGR